MHVVVEQVEELWFDDGSPVTAASGIARLGDGHLVVQDDATHAAWSSRGAVRAVRVLPAVGGLERFSEAAGTKHLKPDLEAACEVDGGVLLLGSGSSPARMRGALVAPSHDAVASDLTELYAAVAGALGVGADLLNLEGACLVGEVLRWFQRGLPAAGAPSGSVDLDLAQLLAVLLGEADPAAVTVTASRAYDLGTVDGVPLAVTDAVALDDATVLVSAVAEDAATTRDDGPVAGAALVLLDAGGVRASAPLPLVDGEPPKVEGLAWSGRSRLLAVVDADRADTASRLLHLRLD